MARPTGAAARLRDADEVMQDVLWSCGLCA
jgi:hypothetical protein